MRFGRLSFLPFFALFTASVIVVKETVQAAVARGTVVPWLGNEDAQMQVVRFDSGNKYFKVQHNDTRILVLYRQ